MKRYKKNLETVTVFYMTVYIETVKVKNVPFSCKMPSIAFFFFHHCHNLHVLHSEKKQRKKSVYVFFAHDQI